MSFQLYMQSKVHKFLIWIEHYLHRCRPNDPKSFKPGMHEVIAEFLDLSLSYMGTCWSCLFLSCAIE
jgi:hypothetical protein